MAFRMAAPITPVFPRIYTPAITLTFTKIGGFKK